MVMVASSRAVTKDSFSPLKAGRKSEAVFRQITQFIRNGRFKPGSKLPAERELAQVFNTSRPTVREALYHAELVGLIATRHGAGSFIVSDTPREPIDRPLAELIEKEAHRVGEFFEIRRAVEGWCAAQAAKSARKEDLAEIKRHLDQMKKLAVTDAEWETHDVAFHHALAAATRNPLAVRIIDVLREGFSAFYRLKRFVPNREDQKTIWQHHNAIYQAVRRQSPDAARQAILDHMDFIEEKLGEGMSGI